MTAPLKPQKHVTSLPSVYKTTSESSTHPDPENTPTPNFTPSETPPQVPSSGPSEPSDSEKLGSSNMDDDAKGDGSNAKEGVAPTVTDSPTAQVEAMTQDTGESKVKKVNCRKHAKAPVKAKKRSKAKAEPSSSEDSSSSDDSSSSNASEDSTESDSSSEEDAQAAKKRKLKAKKAKKLKEKKRAKSRKHKEVSEEDSESDSSDGSSSEEEDRKKRSKLKKKRRSKKSKKQDEESESEEDPNDPLAIAKAQLNALNIRRSIGRRSRGGRLQIDDLLLKKSLNSKAKGKKKKRYVHLFCARVFG